MSQQIQQFITDRDVAARYGIGRATVWRWISVGDFPPPLKLSPKCARWTLSMLEQWEQSRISQ